MADHKKRKKTGIFTPSPKQAPKNQAEEWERFKIRYHENKPKARPAQSTLLLRLCEKSPNLRQQTEAAMDAGSMALFMRELFKKLANDPGNMNSPMAQHIAGVKGAELDEAIVLKTEIDHEFLEKVQEHSEASLHNALGRTHAAAPKPELIPQPRPEPKSEPKPEWVDKGARSANHAAEQQQTAAQQRSATPKEEATLKQHRTLPSFMDTRPIHPGGNGEG